MSYLSEWPFHKLWRKEKPQVTQLITCTHNRASSTIYDAIFSFLIAVDIKRHCKCVLFSVFFSKISRYRFLIFSFFLKKIWRNQFIRINVQKEVSFALIRFVWWLWKYFSFLAIICHILLSNALSNRRTSFLQLTILISGAEWCDKNAMIMIQCDHGM